MLNKKISVSEQVENLSLEAKLIFSWSIPHSDDLGLLPDSHKTLKATITPMWEISLDDFSEYIFELITNNLFEEFSYKGEHFYRIAKFYKHQTLKKEPVTILQDKVQWTDLEKIGILLEDDGNKIKNKKSKVSKKKPITASLDYLGKIPKEDIKEFVGKFNCNEKQVKSKGDDLTHYCKSKGRIYKNYKSFLRNALKSDFGDRADVKKGKYQKLG